MSWNRQIPDPLAICLALAFYLFALAFGIWLVTR